MIMCCKMIDLSASIYDRIRLRPLQRMLCRVEFPTHAPPKRRRGEPDSPRPPPSCELWLC